MNFKKVFSVILCLIMIFSVLPPNSIVVFAAEGDTEIEVDPPTEEKDIVSGDFEFKIRTDGTAQVTNYTGSAEIIEVPSSAEGYTVTAVKKLGLGADFKAKTIVLPKTVVSVLDYEENPESTASAFYNYKTLENFVVSEENPAFCSVDGVLFSKDMTHLVCYPSGNPRQSYVIPDGVTVIVEDAFWFSEKLTELILPEGLIEIEADGIRGCSGLTQIKLPQSLRILQTNAFMACSKLKSIEIPEGVTEIPFGAFWSCYELSKVKLPSTITLIDSYAFAACYPLTEINFPEGLLKMGGLCFALCSKLTTVTLPKSLQSVKASVFQDSGVKTIRGYTGSVAEKIANVKGFEFVPLDEQKLILGDINFDGVVNSNDYAIIKSYVLCQSKLTAEQLAVSDFNEDGTVDAFDAIAIDMHIHTAV